MAKKLNYDPNEKCTQAIVFARVSSKKQKDKGVSLDVQMETITQYCIDNGLQNKIKKLNKTKLNKISVRDLQALSSHSSEIAIFGDFFFINQ